MEGLTTSNQRLEPSHESWINPNTWPLLSRTSDRGQLLFIKQANKQMEDGSHSWSRKPKQIGVGTYECCSYEARSGRFVGPGLQPPSLRTNILRTQVWGSPVREIRPSLHISLFHTFSYKFAFSHRDPTRISKFWQQQKNRPAQSMH